MKKYIIISFAAIAGLLLAACNKQNLENGAKQITVEAGIGNLTKVSYEGDKSSFTKDDNLSLFVWTGDKAAIPATLVVNGVVNTLGADGKWQPDTQMLWDDMTTPHYFMAVSPARKVKSFTADEYVLDPAVANYQQSDLLIATNVQGLVATDNPVSLNFDHAMAKLNLNLSFHNQWTEGNPPSQTVITEAKIEAVSAEAKDHATVDYMNKAVTATGNAVQVAMNKVENAQWTTLMVPQEGFRTLTITLKGNDEWLGGNGTFVFTASEDIKLTSGKVTTVNLIIGRDQITLDKDGIVITDWESQGDATNGEVRKPQKKN